MLNLTKPALEKDAGGTLTFDVPDAGTVTEATVSVFDYGGNPVPELQAQAATISGSTLSFAVPGVNVPTLGRNYYCAWKYKANGVAIGPRRTTFEVIKAALYQTLTETKLTTTYATILAGRHPPGVTDFQKHIDRGWAIMQAKLRGFGKDPNLIIDPRPLEPAHALYTASLIASNYAPGKTADWREWADAKRAEADIELETVLANLEWYDLGEDLYPSYDEENAAGLQLRVTR